LIFIIPEVKSFTYWYERKWK